MKVEWYSVNNWGTILGPYGSRSHVIDDIKLEYDTCFVRMSFDEYVKDFIIFPQINKDS